jgi:hypothetical protein
MYIFSHRQNPKIQSNSVSHHQATKQANPTAATIASALARTAAPELASGPQQARS